LRTALADGPRAGTWAAAGSGVGNLLWGSASALGVAALLAASATAFSMVKLAGAAYLVLIGVQTLVAAARGERLGVKRGERGDLSRAKALSRGLASDLLNVKVGLWSACSGRRWFRSSSPLTAAPCFPSRWLPRWASWSSRGSRPTRTSPAG
jgi:threonine/homoserine/homoserine lactone efflux protein